MSQRKSQSPFTRSIGELSKSAQQEVTQTVQTTHWLASLDPTVLNDKETEGIHRPLLGLLGGLFFALLMFGFTFKLFSLQVVAGQRYEELANGNRIREHIQYAERGTIFDRNGSVLAHNVAGYQIYVNPYQLPQEESARESIYASLSDITSLSKEDVKARIERQGLNYVLPVAIGRQIDHRKSLSLEIQLEQLPGVHLGILPTREYVSDAGLGHVLGYTGLVNESDLEQREELSLVDYVGRSGVEAQYDDVLRGENGYERYEVDALGRPLRLLASKEPTPGKDIYLTIDLDVQKKLYQELQTVLDEGEAEKASASMIDPNSGEVIAMASLPAYDNNMFEGGISLSDYRKIADDPNNPLYNKAIAGGYPSGSIIKPIVAAAALEEGIVTKDTVIVDRGFIDIPNRYGGPSARFYGWNRSGLGPMNVTRAIAMSSNIYFFTVGGGDRDFKGLGSEKLTSYYREFGLGTKTGIDLPGEIDGLIPDSQWRTDQGQRWTLGDTYNISIGQGDLKVNTLQMTTAINAVANGGSVYKPHVLLRVEGSDNVQPEVVNRVPVSDENLEIVREGMQEMVRNGTTCACRFTDIPVPFGGKTGTAETKANKQDDAKPHGWFVSFAPYENPEIGMTVLVEKGGGGTFTAVPVTNKTLGYFFNR